MFNMFQKEWEIDPLQKELKSLFDQTGCTVGEFVETYEEASKMVSSCRFLNEKFRIKLIDCISYYDSQRFKSNRLKRMSKWKRRKFLIHEKLSNTNPGNVKYLINLGSVCLEMLEVKGTIHK